MKKLILASASPRRREILEMTGFAFEIKASDQEGKPKALPPGAAAEELAMEKAQDIAAREPGPCVVLGADTIVVCDGKILGKPADEADARRMLAALQGRSHEVYTGVVLIEKGGCERVRRFHQRTEVTVYPMTEAEIEAYVATGEPMDKAGAYGIQGRFGMYIEKINGDYLNVVGLPLARLYQELKAMGKEETTG